MTSKTKVLSQDLRNLIVAKCTNGTMVTEEFLNN